MLLEQEILHVPFAQPEVHVQVQPPLPPHVVLDTTQWKDGLPV